MSSSRREQARRLGAEALALSRLAVVRLRTATAEVVASIPPEARKELRSSLWRLRKIRSPQAAVTALETELGTLLQVVTPMLAEHPLPVRREGTARAVVGSSAALAAAGEQVEVIIGIFSSGTAVPATLPIALAAIFLSLVIELYVATSVRVHALRAAGTPVDPRAVAAEVAWAMGGASGRPTRAVIARKLVTRLSARMVSRLGRGLVPVAGAAYSGWDAQRTIAAITRLETPPPPQWVGRVPKPLPSGDSSPGR